MQSDRWYEKQCDEVMLLCTARSVMRSCCSARQAQATALQKANEGMQLRLSRLNHETALLRAVWLALRGKVAACHEENERLTQVSTRLRVRTLGSAVVPVPT